MRTVSILLAAVLLLAVAALSATAADGPDLSWWLIGSGSRVSAGAVSLSGGVGQGVAGVVEVGSASMCSGFWCVPSLGPPPPIQNAYLPMVVR